MSFQLRTHLSRCIIVTACLVVLACGLAHADSLYKGDEATPSDAIVLFNGKDLSAWVGDGGTPAPWNVESGYMEVTGGNMISKQEFGDCQVHVEFWLPLMADARGQGRANSGVYLRTDCEVQVLDSYGLNSQNNDCGAIYSHAAPLVNACRPPENWQTYDIIFHMGKFDDKGTKLASARITVFQNGVLIHDNYELPGTDPQLGRPAPLLLQDHGNPIRYRNVWVRPLAATAK